MGDYLNLRREQARKRLEAVRKRLDENPSWTKVACVYVTGSFGRGEGGNHSDIDLFISGTTDTNGARELSALEEICLKADLIRAIREESFPDFSGDGEYVKHYTIKDLVDSLGTSDDDAKNTFTARLLLLLESQAFIGEGIYTHALRETITSYWRDYQDHPNEFMPTFLVNDVLRLWRTFCVNYEARTQSDPPEKKAKRKLKNYKLKHSRLLTCYSAIAHLLALHGDKGTVTQEDALAMTRLSPTQRLEDLRDRFKVDATLVGDVLDRYERFLKATDKPKAELVAAFKEPDFAQEHLEQANKFGDTVASLLTELRAGARFYRSLIA